MLTPEELLIAGLIAMPFALIPSLIGIWRGHPKLGKLIAVNLLLLPFFGIGWILALIWAVTVPDPAPRRVGQASAQEKD